MGRGHDAIACDAGGGDLRPAWSRQKQVSPNDELRYHNDFQRRRVIAADVTFSETRSGLAGPVRVLREPLGVVVAIVPWEAQCWPPQPSCLPPC
jgi:hypothetical protein